MNPTTSPNQAILQSLDSITSIPSFPDIVLKISRLIQDPSSSTDDIAEALKYDVAIASAILRIANSVAYNMGDKITSLPDAIVRIGFTNIKDVVLSIALIKNFKGHSRVNYPKFWQHSLSVAFASQIIECISTKKRTPSNDTFMIGLLHDLGILILDQFCNELYTPVLEKAAASEIPLYQLERDLLGIDHSEVGAYLLKRWNLPEKFIDSIRYQDTPHIITPNADKSTKILHIANFACENQGITNGVESFPMDFSKTAWFDIGLSVDDIPEIIQKVNEEVEKAKAIFNSTS